MDAVARLSGATPVPRRVGAPLPAEAPKRGEVLPYRRRSGVTEAPAARAAEATVLIHCAGRDFVARVSMAEIFLRHSAAILTAGGSELVPLLHEDGLDLLLITPSTVVTSLPAL